MPDETIVNPQVTDAVTQANVKVLGEAPAMALANLYQATAQALSNAAHNATSAQQNGAVVAQAATTMGVTTLYSLDTASAGEATTSILSNAVGMASAAVSVGHLDELIASLSKVRDTLAAAPTGEQPKQK